MDRVMSYDDISTQHINVVLTSRKKANKRWLGVNLDLEAKLQKPVYRDI